MATVDIHHLQPDIGSLLHAVSFRALMEGTDYDKLEFVGICQCCLIHKIQLHLVGDNILKLVITIHLLLSYRLGHERLMEIRHSFISNVKLARICIESGLYRYHQDLNERQLCAFRYIRHLRLGEHSWRPSGFDFMNQFCASQSIEWPSNDWDPAAKDERRKQKITLFIKSMKLSGHKMLADVLEAVIGAFYVDKGIEAAVNVIDRMGVAQVDYICESMRNHKPFSHYSHLVCIDRTTWRSFLVD